MLLELTYYLETKKGITEALKNGSTENCKLLSDNCYP